MTTTTARRRNNVWIVVGVLLAVFCCVSAVVLGGGGYFLFHSGSTEAVSAPVESATGSAVVSDKVEKTPVPAEPVIETDTPTLVPSSTPAPAVTEKSGFDFVERPVTVTVQVIGQLDWNEQLVIDGWIESDCLYPGVRCYYNQSAVGETQTIENIEVKPGAELVFGAVSADVTVKDLATGENYKLTRSGGVYGTVPAGLLIVKLTITDGFMAMTAASDAQNEFCARVAQTYAENWSLTTTFPNPSWTEPICSGTYKVPVDSDRLNGGSIPALCGDGLYEVDGKCVPIEEVK